MVVLMTPAPPQRASSYRLSRRCSCWFILLIFLMVASRRKSTAWIPTRFPRPIITQRSLLLKTELAAAAAAATRSSVTAFQQKTVQDNPPAATAAAVLEPATKSSSGTTSTGSHVSPTSSTTSATTPMTLSRYMMELAHHNPDYQEIESIFSSLQTATKTISHLVRRAHLTPGLTGTATHSINIQGEEQKQLDIITNTVLKQALSYTGKVSIVASEEEDVPLAVRMPPKSSHDADVRPVSGDAGGEVVVDHEGRYTALFDPLDGSANVDAGIPVGTIFGIYRNVDNKSMDTQNGNNNKDYCPIEQNTLQPGKRLVAAGYCLYSSSTMLVFSLGHGVVGFTLDDTIGEYVLTHPSIVMPKRGRILSFNQGNFFDWDTPLQNYVRNLQLGLGETQTRYSSRYIGSLVADVHRTLLYGGIFGYPADRFYPHGKLRLLYEVAPMAFLVEQAGGRALSGTRRILDIEPKAVHQRVHCVLGSRDDVLEMRKYYYDDDDDYYYE